MSVLSMNSIAFSVKDNQTFQAGQQYYQLQWLEEQLSTAEKWRKFIITNHIYYGSQLKDEKVKALWTSDYTRSFAQILERYADKVVIEISGHEHVADVRYHNGSVFSSSLTNNTTRSNEGPFRYHNMVINPGVTSLDG